MTCVEEQKTLNFSNISFKHLNSVGDMFELWINWYVMQPDAVNMRSYVSYYCESTLSYLDMVEYVLYKNNNMYFGFLAVFMLQFSMPRLEIVLKSTVYWLL